MRASSVQVKGERRTGRAIAWASKGLKVQIVKRSLRDWFIFSFGITGLVADYIFAHVFHLPTVNSPVLFACSLLATVMGSVGLPIAALAESYEGAAEPSLGSRRRLVGWGMAMFVTNFVASGLFGPLATSNSVHSWSLSWSMVLSGLGGLVPWLVVNGIVASTLAVLVFFILRSIFIGSDEVVTSIHMAQALGVASVSFLVSDTLLAPLGTVGWALARQGPIQHPVTDLQRLLFSAIGVALVTGVLLHYLLLSFPQTDRPNLVRNIELTAGGIGTISITVAAYFTIGIGDEAAIRLPYMLVLPQFISAFVAVYYSTLWIVVGARAWTKWRSNNPARV